MKRFILPIKSFTLVELMVTFLLLTIIIMAIYTVLNLATAFYPVDMGLLDLQQQSRQAMEWLTREARQSSSKAGSITITTISSNIDSITFTTPTKASVYYYLNNDRLMREYPSGTIRIIAQNITRLKFTRTNDVPNNSSILTIEVGAAKTILSKPLSIQINEKVRIRNAN
ncbi:MAG: hypothetical protein WCX16_01000 [Candidatus Omnitrophota bacterium]